MNLKHLARKAISPLSRQVTTVQRHSPVLLFGVGMVSVGTAAVLACRATLKMGEVFDEAEKELAGIDEKIARLNEEGLDVGILKKSRFKTQLRIALRITKLYAPAVIVGVASVGALTGSHVILQRRNAGLAAAYAVVDKTFKDYRARVVEDQGEQKDLEYRFGTVEKEVVDETETGPVVSTVKQLDVDKVRAGESGYARTFDEMNKHWKFGIPGANVQFLQGWERFFNDRLRLNGRVFLNEVYEELGFEQTEAGQVVGWLRSPESDKADGYISFGLGRGGIEKKEFMRGLESYVILDFNVDGVILKSLPKI